MTSHTLYRQFLAADWLLKKLKGLEIEVASVDFRRDHWASARTFEDLEQNDDLAYGFMFDIHVELQGLYLVEDRERAAEGVLEKVPGARIFRKNGYIYLYGEAPGMGSVRWHISLGMGSCEKVQVGTRKVMRPDPDAPIVEIPLIEVDEPIFEIRCVDPITQAVNRG